MSAYRKLLTVTSLASLSIFFSACSNSKTTPKLTDDQSSCAFSTGSRINSRGIVGRGAGGCTTLPPISNPITGGGTGTGTGSGSGDPTKGGGLGDPGEGGLGGGSGTGSKGGLDELLKGINPDLFLPGRFLEALRRGLIDPSLFKGKQGEDLLAALSQGLGVPISAVAWEPLFASGEQTGGSTVTVYRVEGTQPLPIAIVEAYPGFQGGVNVALGDVNGDHFTDLITGAGPGGGPHVRAFLGGPYLYQAEYKSFFAYDQAFRGGVHVAVADLNGDDYADIITGAGQGGGPHVMVFSGKTGQPLASFFAYDPAFTGGVRVAAGDIDGDGYADIITGAGPGGGPHVKVFRMLIPNGAEGQEVGLVPQEIRSFFAYDPAFRGGINVAATDYNGTAQFRADIITGADAGGGPHVKVFDGGSGGELASYFAYGQGFGGGVSVAGSYLFGNTDNETNRGDIVTGARRGGGPHIIGWAGRSGNPQAVMSFFDGASSDTTGRTVGAALGY